MTALLVLAGLGIVRCLALPLNDFEFHSIIFLKRSLILLKPLMELHVPQGVWPQRVQERPALEAVPQEQQDHIDWFADFANFLGKIERWFF